MRKYGIAALLEANHHNIRYLTALKGFAYPMCRYVLFFAEHDAVMYEHDGYYHQMPDQCPWIKEWRPARSWLTGAPGPAACMHLTIESEEGGRLIARDLDSVNGLHLRADNKRVATLDLHSGTQFRIGRTLMRYCNVEHPLAPTILDRENGESRLASPYALAGAGMLLLLVLCLESYLSTIERVTFAKIVSEPLTTVSMLLTWCGVWALASRIVVSRFHFSPHAVIACGAILSFFALSTVSEWTEFLFPFIPALWIAGLFGAGLILAALVYGHLRFASTMRRRSRLLAALAISAAVVGVSFISDYAGRSKFSNVMLVSFHCVLTMLSYENFQE